MAIYSLRVQKIGRSAGKSIIAAAAYRSGSALTDERLGWDFDFSGKRRGVAHTAIIAPENTPAELLNREALWNAVDKVERRTDATTAREILVALPHELNEGQRRELVEDFARKSLAKRGMIADVAVHYPGKDGDTRNHHAHILVTMRHVGPEGFGNKNREWETPQFVRDVRREWAEVANRHLERHAPNVPKISEKTLAEQGIERAPTEHQGPEVTAMERRGERTYRGENNRDIQAENFGRQREAQLLDRSVADSFDAGKWTPRPTDQIIRDMEATRVGLARQRDAWRQERDAIEVPRPVSIRQLEAQLTSKEAEAYQRARQQEEEAERQAHANGVSLKKIAFWHANPAQAAMQSLVSWNADLDRVAAARAESGRAKKELEERRAWTKSPEGRDQIQNLRQADLDAAATAAAQRRTLDRKLKRLDKRIDEADRAILETKAAKRLGYEQLRVPTSIPKAPGEGTANARRYFRFMATESRVALAATPAPERDAALKFVKMLAPGAPVPSVNSLAPMSPLSTAQKRSRGPEIDI